MLVKMALKGVLNTRLSIATRYEAESQLLYVKIDDPLGQIYAQMSRVINQDDSESLKALSTSAEIEPMILKGIIEKNGGEIQIQKPSRNSEGYSVSFTMRMHTLENALDSQGEVIVDFDAKAPSIKNEPLPLVEKDGQYSMERDLEDSSQFAPLSQRNQSVVIEDKKGYALSEQYSERLGALSVLDKFSFSSDDDDDELSLGFLIRGHSDEEMKEVQSFKLPSELRNQAHDIQD